jgi:REP element-mobilizing transposase RayT
MTSPAQPSRPERLDLSAASDREVVGRAREGLDDAYRELVRRYRDRVLASVFRIVRHRERAEDLAQEAFVSAFGDSAAEAAARRLRRRALEGESGASFTTRRAAPSRRFNVGTQATCPKGSLASTRSIVQRSGWRGRRWNPYDRVMPHALYVHLVWVTLERRRMITGRVASFLRRFLPAEATRHGCEVVALGLVPDHVHMVLRIPPRGDLPRMVQGLTGASSRLGNLESTVGLRWEKGYQIKTVSPSGLPRVIAYVKNQAQRHGEVVAPGD